MPTGNYNHIMPHNIIREILRNGNLFFIKKQAALRLPYKRVVELRLVEPELSTEHLSAYYIGFIACGLSCILFVLLAVIRIFNYHRSTHLIYNFTMTKVSATMSVQAECRELALCRGAA